MISINLLPYRAEQKKSGQLRFLIQVVLVVVIAAVVLGGLHWYYNGKISDQRAQNQQLEQAIFSLTLKNKTMKDLKIQAAELLQRLAVIESLQKQRHQVVAVLSHWPVQLPDGIYLLELKREGNVLTLDGLAESHQQVSDLMRQMEGLPNYQQVRLQQVQTNTDKKQAGFKHFSIKADLVLPAPIKRSAP